MQRDSRNVATPWVSLFTRPERPLSTSLQAPFPQPLLVAQSQSQLQSFPPLETLAREGTQQLATRVNGRARPVLAAQAPSAIKIKAGVRWMRFQAAFRV